MKNQSLINLVLSLSLPFPLRFASECDKAVYCCTCDDCEGLSLSLPLPPPQQLVIESAYQKGRGQ